MWDWITDAFTITFGEALLENLYLIIVIYIISLGYLNYSINRDLDKILGSENANENEDEEQVNGNQGESSRDCFFCLYNWIFSSYDDYFNSVAALV